MSLPKSEISEILYAMGNILTRLTDRVERDVEFQPFERRELLNTLYKKMCGIQIDEILKRAEKNHKLRIKRGDTNKNNEYVGPAGEITMDTDTKTIRIHDGQTTGGVAMARTDSIINMMIPDYSAGVAMPINLTERTYVCPENGVIVADTSGFNWAYGYIKINGITMFNITTNGSGAIVNGNAMFIVGTGDIVTYKSGYVHDTVHPSTNLLTFYPFRGNK